MKCFRRKCGINWLNDQPTTHTIVFAGSDPITSIPSKEILPEHWSVVKPLLLEKGVFMKHRNKRSTIKKKKRRQRQHATAHELIRVEKQHHQFYLQSKTNGLWLIRNDSDGPRYEYHTPHNPYSEQELLHISTANYNVISVYDYERRKY